MSHLSTYWGLGPKREPTLSQTGTQVMGLNEHLTGFLMVDRTDESHDYPGPYEIGEPRSLLAPPPNRQQYRGRGPRCVSFVYLYGIKGRRETPPFLDLVCRLRGWRDTRRFLTKERTENTPWFPGSYETTDPWSRLFLTPNLIVWEYRRKVLSYALFTRFLGRRV